MVNGNLRTAIARYFRQGAFLRDFSIVMSGTAFAQLIGFALMPVVSRLFTPSDFGVFGSYNAVLAVFSAFVTLQYNQAIVLPKKTQDAINLFFVSCLSVALVTGLCVLATLVFPEQAQDLINAPNRWFLLFLTVSVLIAGLNQSLQSWCIRVQAFTHTSISPVIRSLSAAGIWTATGIGDAGAAGLVLGSICAEVLSSLNLSRVLKRDLKKTRILRIPGHSGHRFRAKAATHSG
ncbi:MAG: oligosaccharide flippase family protein [Bacteroidales bacterium]|nr:oligosaccharide flippase family protein [Bacteroidales bacterium]